MLQCYLLGKTWNSRLCYSINAFIQLKNFYQKYDFSLDFEFQIVDTKDIKVGIQKEGT